MSTTMSTALSTASLEEGIGGLFLPPHLVGYIASFIKVNFDSNLLLNMYKAFESIHGDGYEDRLVDYKAQIQSHIAYLAMDGVFLDERDEKYALTEREIMYVFDCYYCDPSIIMYGEESYENVGEYTYLLNTEQMRHVEHEFLDCSEFTETLALPQLGIQFGLSDELNIKMYKYIRLLEEALRLKSTALIAFMKEKIVISQDMLLYIYIKHNHELYAPNWFSLASDDMLLDLCREFGILSTVLGMSIGGHRRHHVYNEAGLKNVVRSNFEVVKKIVPQYITAFSEVIPYEDYDENDLFISDEISPIKYWQRTCKSKVILSPLGSEDSIIKLEGSGEIGAYLQSFE